MKILLSFFPYLDIEAPGTTVTATKDELLKYFKQMYTMRRMEITNDTEYKVRLVTVTIHPVTVAVK